MDRIKQANEWMAKALPTVAKLAIPGVGQQAAIHDIAGPVLEPARKAVEGAMEGYANAVPRRMLGELARPDEIGNVARTAVTPGFGIGQKQSPESTNMRTIMAKPDVQQIYQEQGPQAAWKYASEKYLPGGQLGAAAFETVVDPMNAVPIPAEKAARLVGKAAEVAGPVLKQGAKAYFEAANKMPALGMTIEDVTRTAGAAVPPVQPPTEIGTLMPEEGFAGNIRLSKYPEELQTQIKAAFEAAPEKFEEARRGVIPDAQVQEQAKALVESVGGNFRKQMQGWQKGQAWNAEEILALREVLTTNTKAVLEAQQAVRQTDSTENLAKLQEALMQQASTQEMVSGVTAEAGRALRQFRQTLSGAIASGDQAKIADILDKVGGRGKVEDIAKGLSQIDITDQEAVFKFIRNATKPELGDYLMEIFYNSILSGPRTHLVNAIGNTLSTLMAPVERAAAGAVDVGLSAATGAPRSRFVGEVAPEVFGMARGITEGVTKALYVLRKGYSLDDLAKLEIRKPQAFKGTAGDVLNIPSRMLAASDALFRSVNYSGALNAGAYRIARQEGLKGEELAARTAELLADPPK
jgi:hypothetical protein